MITFRGSGSLESSDIVTSGYVQDHWRLNDRLALDLGQRFDRDEMIGEESLLAEGRFSLALDPHALRRIHCPYPSFQQRSHAPELWP